MATLLFLILFLYSICITVDGYIKNISTIRVGHAREASDKSGTGDDAKSYASCPTSAPTLVSCALFSTKHQIDGSFASTTGSSTQCVAINGNGNTYGVFALATCVSSDFTCSYSKGSMSGPDVNDSSTTSCPSSKIMVGCTATSSWHSISGSWISSDGICHATNDGSAKGVYAHGICCEYNGNDGYSLDCETKWSDHKSDEVVAVQCDSGYALFGCSGWSPSKYPRDTLAMYGAWSTQPNYCTANSVSSKSVYAVARCCKLYKAPTAQPTASPTASPTALPTASPTAVTLHPTYEIEKEDLFTAVSGQLTFPQAKEYCESVFDGLANIYDPNENNMILRLVSLGHIDSAFIGYAKHMNEDQSSSEWRWQSNVSSDPMLWLQSPLAPISSNIEDPTTNCMYISRYGWHYTQCDIASHFICETRDHRPHFTENASFAMNVDRKLKYDDARSLCRAQYYDLATIYEEDEYKIAQELFSHHTNNATNCWIGYKRGVLNENEWLWMQDIPTTAIPINQLTNTNLWSLDPWQSSTATVYCQALSHLTILYASDGVNFDTNTSETFQPNKTIVLEVNGVTYDSKLQFVVNTKANSLPGLRCSVYFENDIYNTEYNTYTWSVVSSTSSSLSYDVFIAQTTADLLDVIQTSPDVIQNESQWIWNERYEHKSEVTASTSVTFEFSFENVQNIQNRDGDNCASISYYSPYKWKTNHCEERFYFICNKYDHKPAFKLSSNEEFALLVDRELTRTQGASLCQSIYGNGMATIYSYHEFNVLQNMMNTYNIQDAWIGLSYDDTTFIDSNNLDNSYGWDTEPQFIFDDWTLNAFNFAKTDDIAYNGECIQQQLNGSEANWKTANCNTSSYVVCNYEKHSPEFTSSQLGAFYLLENQVHNYWNGEQLCRDYVGLRSKAAIIYHPIENERAIWLCSNASNDRGCFIGYNNLEYRNMTKFRWRNGALIDVFADPWFGNPWFNISNDTTNIDQMLTNKYGGNDSNQSYCSAIIKDEDADEWRWDIVDCEEELNILCDSGDDHSQCWMLQNCAQCALRRDCGWCGNRCQLLDEICYEADEFIEQEFGCDDYDPIINITYEQNCNYTYSVDISMCASTAPQATATQYLEDYVNFSNCVIQKEIIEFYILSDYKEAMFGNYAILGKVIELKQATQKHFENQTRFDDHPVCDISIYHGYVRSITCSNQGAGYANNATQFDMLHDILRYLLPRLQQRLFEGEDIAEDSLFGYSTMARSYDDFVDHSIERKFSKESLVNERYANATTDLLWKHRTTVNSRETEINHLNFSMVHVFSQIPHHNESQKIKLFTWCGYELSLINKQSIASSQTDELRQELYNMTDVITNNYTMDQWRGIRSGDFMLNFESEADKNYNRRRRLSAAQMMVKLCRKLENYSTPRDGELVLGIWEAHLWVSELVEAFTEDGHSAKEFIATLFGVDDAFPDDMRREAWPVIPGFLKIDVGIMVSAGLGWKATEKPGSKEKLRQKKIELYINRALYRKGISPKKDFDHYCPQRFKFWSKFNYTIAEDTMAGMAFCCGYREIDKGDCSLSLREINELANKCMRDYGVYGSWKKPSEWTKSRGLNHLAFDSNWEPPNLKSVFDLVVSGVNAVMNFDEFKEQFVNPSSGIFELLGTSSTAIIVAKSENPIINFILLLHKIYKIYDYWKEKEKYCSLKKQLVFLFDVIIDLGFTSVSLRDMCSLIVKRLGASRRRRMMQDLLYVTYKIMPVITLPCIPIAPPALMLCPSIDIQTRFGLESPSGSMDSDSFNLEISPFVSFEITAELALTLGIPILQAQIAMGVRVSLVQLQLPISVGVSIDDFGLSGNIGMDFKVLELSIFLEFRLCAGISFFRYCYGKELWRESIVAWEYSASFFKFGMGSKAETSAIASNVDDATSEIRFYLAFKDDADKYNGAYDYEWEYEYFTNLTFIDQWQELDLLDLSSCALDETASFISTEWHILNDSIPDSIKTITNCEYNFQDDENEAIFGFDKLLIIDMVLQWYSLLEMQTCFSFLVQTIFEDNMCCDFAIRFHDAITTVTGREFDISSYKIIAMDIADNWYPDQCVEFYLNTEVQIDDIPFYDDCSEGGWKIAQGLSGEYKLGTHDIYGEDTMLHYNQEETCLNWFNSTKITKVKRRFEILSPYNIMMIGVKFWAKISSAHNSTHWYAIRFYNETNYYWINNVNTVCVATQDAFASWYNVDISIDSLSDSTSYCYTDVLIYIDPLIDATNKYHFDLEIIANVPSDESWGFSHFVINTFDDEDVCVKGVNPVIELETEYTAAEDVEYIYYGLKHVPSLYYGYVLFDISFDYRFHDVSALISLSSDDTNNQNTAHWIINFDDDQSGIWIRCGTEQIPSNGVLTLNEELAANVVDIDLNADIVYTQMYIQWNADEADNYMRVGFGRELGSNIIATIAYDRFKFDTSTMIKYIGFARSLGSSLPDVKWKIYSNNLLSYCFSPGIEDTVTAANTQNYKQSCIGSDKIIYDLVTPQCLDIESKMKYTFSISKPHNYVMLNMKLFADLTSYVNITSYIEGERIINANWNPNIGEICSSKYFDDRISNQISVGCYGSFDTTFKHLSQQNPFDIWFQSDDADLFGIADIQLRYGSCFSVLPLIQYKIRYNSSYAYISNTSLHSISSNYILGMIQCTLDEYASSETYISIRSSTVQKTHFIVRLYDNVIELWKSGNILINRTAINDVMQVINNTEWFQFYIVWNQEDEYFEFGSGRILHQSPLLVATFIIEQDIIVDSVGLMHSNEYDHRDWNAIHFQFISTDLPQLCWEEEDIASVSQNSWVNTEMNALWLPQEDTIATFSVSQPEEIVSLRVHITNHAPNTHTITIWFKGNVYQCEITPKPTGNHTCNETQISFLGCDTTSDKNVAKILFENEGGNAYRWDEIALTTNHATYGIHGVCISDSDMNSSVGASRATGYGNHGLCDDGYQHFSGKCIDSESSDCAPSKQLYYFDLTQPNIYIDDALWEDGTSTSLTNLDPTAQHNVNYGNISVNNWKGFSTMLMADGNTYSEFIVIHPKCPSSYAEWNLNRKYRNFTAVIGLALSTIGCSDGRYTASHQGKSQFNFYVDSVLVHQSPVFLNGDDFELIDIDVSGSDILRIETLCSGTYNCDHDVVANPMLYRNEVEYGSISTINCSQSKRVTRRVSSELNSGLIFNGPYESGDIISKSFTSIYEHDYIELHAKVYGFGLWDVLYAVWLNGLSVLFDDSLIWFGTFLYDGGDTQQSCDISQYKQWFSWQEPYTLNHLPIDIVTDNVCTYDLSVYLKHNSTTDAFSLSFLGDLSQTECDAVPQFNIKLDESIDTTIDGYPLLLNITRHSIVYGYKYCSGLCNDDDECRAWMYNVNGSCWLKSTSNVNIVREEGYISGICNGANIFDGNISCTNNSTYIENVCDCICGDCDPGNEYHYIYIENENELINPLEIGSILYSHSCDFSLFAQENGDLLLKNLQTNNILNAINASELLELSANASWLYPIRIILEGSVLIIADDDLRHTKVYQKHCAIQTDDSYPGALSSTKDIGEFYITNAFAVQFTLEINTDSSDIMKIISFMDANNGSYEHFAFKWNEEQTIFIVFDNNEYEITETGFNTIASGIIDYTIKVSANKLQIWASNAKEGYQSFAINNTITGSIKTDVYSISPLLSNTNSEIELTEICISDLAFQQYKNNEDEFDYNMRCWSGRYKNINRRDEFISSFVSDSGCASVSSCLSSSFGEDVDYIPYYDVLREEENDNDPLCFVDDNTPLKMNNLCIMLKKCASPKQSLYRKAWGFSGVNVTTSTCDTLQANITKKISIEWNNDIEINYGSLQLSSDDVYSINNSFIIFELRPIRFPRYGFDNRSIYISFMDVNDSTFGQNEANVTWTFELNNEFGVKFYRGNRNATQRLIASKYVEDILEPQNENDVTVYCFADNFISVLYASDGETFIPVINKTDGLAHYISFSLEDVTFFSKLRFKVQNSNESASDNFGGLICTIYVNGEQYSTSNDTSYWSILQSTKGGKTVIVPTASLSWISLQESTSFISNDADWIWNYDCISANISNASLCVNESITFEFSFYNVHNPDNAPSFYVEWDSMFGDYIRFGFYNQTDSGIAYDDNFNLILEAGYISNFYSYDIYSDGSIGNHTKIYINDVMFSIANDSYNEDWFVLINIINASDPKPCFGFDLLSDTQTRITSRDLQTFSSWRDDGRSLNWKSNGNIFPGWHNIRYLNLTENSTYNRIETYPYYFHYPFISDQESWQRTFSIDTDIDYDYVEIEVDVYTFCGWDQETDAITVSLAFEEYLQFSTVWTSTHTRYDCEGYNSQTWNHVIDIVRMNNNTHDDISCYAQGMISPSYECKLNIRTETLKQNENVAVIVDCNSLSERNLTLYYAQNGTSFDRIAHNISRINTAIYNTTRHSKLRIDHDVNDSNKSVELKCSITINNYTIYFTNDTTAFAPFEFDFYSIFMNEYELEFINTQIINTSNYTNISWIAFESTPLTQCVLTFHVDMENITEFAISDGDYISSDNNTALLALATINIDKIFIALKPFSYHCRLELFTDCYFNGTQLKLNESSYNNINISGIRNVSSWRLYAEREYECFATFYDSLFNETYTINAEDGGMISESCNPFNTFEMVNITVLDAHYGCYQHVRFHAPNTNSHPFVLRIEAAIEDISPKFGSFTKSWGFGNLSITPLICSSYSNIVPLKTPFTLSSNNGSKIFTTHELSSIEYDYVFLMITTESNATDIDFSVLLGEYEYLDNYWNISVTNERCMLKNIKLGTEADCSENEHYLNFMNETQQLLWMSWDPFDADTNARNFSFGIGSQLKENVIASLNIYGDEHDGSYLDYIQFVAPTNDASMITIYMIQFASPKICLSQSDESNKIDVGELWTDDCLASGWELNKYAHIVDDVIVIDEDHNSEIEHCEVTNLNINPITKLATDCFHGPFKGANADPYDYGDYVSRLFYVFSDIEFDVIDVNLNYYGLCTWNPEEYESDTAYVFINNQALWRSAPQYEFVTQYCEGFGLHSDWDLVTEYRDTLNAEAIQCLYLLDQICSYPVKFSFRHTAQEDTFFSIGVGAKLNQHISNEAFGFSNISLSYHICPDIEPLPIGNVKQGSLLELLNEKFSNGDMLIDSTDSIYYLVANVNDSESVTGSCTFILFGGYKMWSQQSSNCTILGLNIMQNDYSASSAKLDITYDGILRLLSTSDSETLWSRRTPCDVNDAYYYYSINKTKSFSSDKDIYSIDCLWKMIINSENEIHFMHNDTSVHNISNVNKFSFDVNGSIIFYDEYETSTTESPKGGDFMIFDEGKLVVFDHDTDIILKQYDFSWAQCELAEDIGVIKYFYFMKPGDILWNGQVLISKNCAYKLILKEGKLLILNETNHQINEIFNWSNRSAERLEFGQDGNIVLYSYSDESESEILWQTETSALLDESIYYADRAILDDYGQLFVMDDATLSVHYMLFEDESFINAIKADYNTNMDCTNSKYDYVDKRYGFYATWISYYNCDDNQYVFSETTTCVAHKYCPIIQHYDNVFLHPTTDCGKYRTSNWRDLSNNYVLFQLSIARTYIGNDPTLYLVLSTSDNIEFGYEFDDESSRTLLITISAHNKSITLETKHHSTSFYLASIFTSTELEWFWIEWNVNFNYIGFGNSMAINEPIYRAEYGQFFTTKLGRDEHLFNHYNLAWNLFNHYNSGNLARNISKCYGNIVVQFPPLNIETPKACYTNTTLSHVTYQYPRNTSSPTYAPSSSPSSPSSPPSLSPSLTTLAATLSPYLSPTLAPSSTTLSATYSPSTQQPDTIIAESYATIMRTASQDSQESDFDQRSVTISSTVMMIIVITSSAATIGAFVICVCYIKHLFAKQDSNEVIKISPAPKSESPDPPTSAHATEVQKFQV